jgi:hypothetical protein
MISASVTRVIPWLRKGGAALASKTCSMPTPHLTTNNPIPLAQSPMMLTVQAGIKGMLAQHSHKRKAHKAWSPRTQTTRIITTSIPGPIQTLQPLICLLMAARKALVLHGRMFIPCLMQAS